MNQLDRNALYVVISPRFTLSKSGHFYWNTLAYEDAFRKLNLDYRIIVPFFEGVEIFLAQNPNFLMVSIGGPNSFGHDNGLISPLRLAQVIGRLIRDLDCERDIFILSFESSLALYVSLIYLSNRDSRVRVSLNLLDFGFWEKLLKMKQPGFKGLITGLKAATNQNSAHFHVFANSGTQPKLFSQLLGTKVFPWPIISVSTNRTHIKELKLDSKELSSKRLLVFPHPDGPMRAVTVPAAKSRVTSFSACFAPNQACTPRASRRFASCAPNGSSRLSTAAPRPGASNRRAFASA